MPQTHFQTKSMSNRSCTNKKGRNVLKNTCFQLTFRENDVSLLLLAKEQFSFPARSDNIFVFGVHFL